MEVSEMLELFEKYSDVCGEFDRIVNPKSKRPDMHAFMLLESLVDSTSDMIISAEHDIVYLGVKLEELANNITEAQVQELRQCGIMVEDEEYLAMFV